ERLASLAAETPSSSTHVARALLLAEPPSIDAHEMTDKGSINQRAVLHNRAALAELLYARPTPPEVITVTGERDGAAGIVPHAAEDVDREAVREARPDPATIAGEVSHPIAE